MSLVQITGIVNSLTYPKNGEATELRIKFPNKGEIYPASYNFYCPLRVGDTVQGQCRLHENKLYFVSPPFATPPVSKEHVVSLMAKHLKIGFAKAYKVYDKFAKRFDSISPEAEVVADICKLAQLYVDEGKSECGHQFEGLEYEEACKFLKFWHKDRNLRRLYLLGLTNKDINACRRTCQDIYDICVGDKSNPDKPGNPYILPAIPIEKADEICRRCNIPINEDQRYLGIIVRLLWKNQHERGWTCTPSKQVAKMFPDLKNRIGPLKERYGVQAAMFSVYLDFPYKVETQMAEYVAKLRLSDEITYDTPVDETLTLSDGSKYTRLSPLIKRELSVDQAKAVQGALDHKICIITGGAGTGKSTTLSVICQNLEHRGVNYAVCSFTGKAVARIREITGKNNPSTIHRLIMNPKNDQLNAKSTQFEKDIPPKTYEHIVIDEASMMTTALWWELKNAYPKVQQWTLVGDANQLPPIDWGSAFAELIKSETIPVYRLTTNYRVYTENGERDGIILNANQIINHDGEYPFEFTNTDNFSVLEGPIEHIYTFITSFQRANIPASSIVVICPYNKYLDKINKEFQRIYNANSPSVVDTRNDKWCVNDRVMMTVNDAEIGVFNGETGIITEVNGIKISVKFPNAGIHDFLLEPIIQRGNYGVRQYVHQGDIADEAMAGDDEYDMCRSVLKLKLGYALTVDKSQGSEWDFVIYYLPEFNTGGFLNKNRHYTAITRAKRAVWCIASNVRAFESSVTQSAPFRHENFARRLSERLPKVLPYSKEAENRKMDNELMEVDVPQEMDGYEEYEFDDYE